MMYCILTSCGPMIFSKYVTYCKHLVHTRQNHVISREFCAKIWPKLDTKNVENFDSVINFIQVLRINLLNFKPCYETPLTVASVALPVIWRSRNWCWWRGGRRSSRSHQTLRICEVGNSFKYKFKKHNKRARSFIGQNSQRTIREEDPILFSFIS